MPKNSYGALIIHGFTDQLDSVQIIESELSNLDIPIQVPLLRGHGKESPEALRGVVWQDWIEDTEAALAEILLVVENVIVIGYSLGGLIAITLAARIAERIDSIVLAGAPVKINAPLAPGRPLHFLTTFINWLIKKWEMPPNYVDTERVKYHTSYPWAPMDSITTLLDLIVEASKLLPDVKVPTLILQSHNDSTTSPESANIIYNTISTSPEEKQIVWFEKTEHEMFRDLERETVVNVIRDYVLKRIEN
jgi:carboxylesterase